MAKAPIPSETKKDKWQHKASSKTSMTQRLQTDLERSIGPTTANQLILLNRFKGLKILSTLNTRQVADIHVYFNTLVTHHIFFSYVAELKKSKCNEVSFQFIPH